MNGRLITLFVEVGCSAKPVVKVPVSYTHLDVYKRQGQNLLRVVEPRLMMMMRDNHWVFACNSHSLQDNFIVHEQKDVFIHCRNITKSKRTGIKVKQLDLRSTVCC